MKLFKHLFSAQDILQVVKTKIESCVYLSVFILMSRLRVIPSLMIDHHFIIDDRF